MWWFPLALAACRSPDPGGAGTVDLRLLPLPEELAKEEHEISALVVHDGAAWLLPQCERGTGCELWRIPLDALEAKPLPVERLALKSPLPLTELYPGWDGFEALVRFQGRWYATAERSPCGGWILAWDDSYQIDAGVAVDLEPPTCRGNKGFEALIAMDNGLIAVFETEAPPAPRAWWWAPGQSLRPVELPPIPYRLTDLSELGPKGEVEALNYRWGNENDGSPRDPWADRFGARGGGGRVVERILPLRWEGGRLVETGAPPWVLPREAGMGRNWEGLARLGEGEWLLVTDEHPATLLARVKAR